MKKQLTRRNPMARELRDAKFAPRVVKNKKGYSRKGRNSSTRQIEDFIQLANGSWAD